MVDMMSNTFMLSFTSNVEKKCVGNAGNGTWLYCYDPEINQQSYQWKNSTCLRLKKARSRVEHREHVGDLV
jgi:hypothetical protein